MQDGNLMHIVFSADNNFVNQLAVTIASILINSNAEDKFLFYVLDGGILDKNKERILQLKKIKDFELEFLEINEGEFSNCPINSHFKIPTYFRIKLPSLVQLEKILYMDCDIIVRKSVKDLYNYDVKEVYAAVVEDICFEVPWLKNHTKNLGLNKYFNAGIALLNLKKMREENIEQKCFDFITNCPEKIVCVDQDVLNAVFSDNVLFVDEKYNFQHNNMLPLINKLYNLLSKDLVVLHFVWCKKPWCFNKSLNFIIEYYFYLFKTPFKSGLVKDILALANNLKMPIFPKKVNRCIKILIYNQGEFI